MSILPIGRAVDALRERLRGGAVALGLVVGAGVLGLGAASARAQSAAAPISINLHYTIAAPAPGGGPATSYSAVRTARLEGPSLAQATISAPQVVAELTPYIPGGLMFMGDGRLLVAASHNTVLQVDPRTGESVTLPASQVDPSMMPTPPAAIDVAPDPSADRAWVVTDRAVTASIELAPEFWPGVAAPINGDDVSLSAMAFTTVMENNQPVRRVFYAASMPPAVPGGAPVRCLGLLNLTTAHTTRIFGHLPAAKCLVNDPYTGHLFLFGGRYVAQVDPAGQTPRLLAQVDLSQLVWGGATLDFVDAAADGSGRLLAVSGDGRLLVLDLAALVTGGDASTVRIDHRDLSFRLFDLEPPPPPGFDPASFPRIQGLAPLAGVGQQQEPTCLWDNGVPDGRSGQLSQVNEDVGHPQTADDLYLCPGRVYRLDALTATLSTDSAFPVKARLEVYDDCDGAPGALLGSFETEDLTDVGPDNEPGFRRFEARFLLGGMVVDGGRGGRTLWVSVRGVGLAVGPEEWYWLTAGDLVVKGRPGAFRSPLLGFDEWTGIEDFGCGCTDFAFRLYGEECKVLVDGGVPDLNDVPLGVLSQIASDADQGRAADDLVVPGCRPQSVCYLRAYMYSNCIPLRGRFELYADACHEPATNPVSGGAPIATAAFQRVTDLGTSVTINGETYRAYLAEAKGLDWVLLPGRNYWIAPVGDTTFALRKRTFAALGRRCDRECQTTFSPAQAVGYGLDLPRWKPIKDASGAGRDLALLVAVTDAPEAPAPPVATCPADTDRSGSVTIQDLFNFLASWFAGCP